MRWKDKLIKDFESAVITLAEDKYNIFRKKISDEKVSLHLAIFSEPFLGFLLNGVKTIESRFSINNVSPFRKVIPGDIVFVKKSAGGLCAIFEVKDVQYYSNLSQKTVDKVNEDLGDRLCWNHDPAFLDLKSQANFLTLIYIDNITEIPEFSINKSDRTGWAVIRRGLQNTLFDNDTNK